MLHLVANNNGGRNFKSISGDESHWRSLFKTSEDSLTSSIFGLFFYLPPELFWSIITDSCYSSELPRSCGRFIGYEFWPRWDNESNTTTEPDILLQFEDFDLIVEAKRYNYNQQYKDQWIGQIRSYYRSGIGINKKLYLLAVGGITRGEEFPSIVSLQNGKPETIVVKTTWSRLLNQIVSHHSQMFKSDSITNATIGISNIFKDLIIAFRLHGFITADLLDTLPGNIRISRASLPESAPFWKKEFLWEPFSTDLLTINNNSIYNISATR